MAETKLSLVDENYKVSSPKPSNEEVLKAHQAAGIREGKRRAKEELGQQFKVAAGAIEHASHRVTDLATSHGKHLTETRKANYHQGLTHGLLAAVLALVAGIYIGVTIQTSGWSMSVAEERIPRSGVPSITDQYEPPAYERGEREPGTASN